MDLETAQTLISPAGCSLIANAEAAIQGGADRTRLLLTLRKGGCSPELAAGVWAIVDGRRRARVKFGDLADTLFTVPEALEQATGHVLARYHAVRFREAGFEAVTDLTGGIGGDAIAFASAGLRVTLIECDPVRALFARENARLAGLGDRIEVIEGDAASFEVRTPAVWLDPARRIDKRRVIDPESYSPPLSLITTLHSSGVAAVGVKLASAVERDTAMPYNGSLEFVSESGECKEALLWTGALRLEPAVSAVMVTASRTEEPPAAGLAANVIRYGEDGMPRRYETEPSSSFGYLYEPDPAVIRAGLVEDLAAVLNASAIDPQIAYLTGPDLFHTPWADAFEILDRMPYRPKNVQKALRERGVGRVIVKKRGVPIEPEDVARELKLDGPNEMILILSRIGQQRIAFLCHRCGRTANGAGLV